MDIFNLPPDMTRNIIKYTPWKYREVNKKFREYIDEDESRNLEMILNDKTNTPFFDGQKFLTQTLPFAYMLKTLNISSSTIEDIGPLADCYTLRKLDLSNCSKLKDISPLAHCITLTSLNLSGFADNCRVDTSPLYIALLSLSLTFQLFLKSISVIFFNARNSQICILKTQDGFHSR